MKMMEVKPYKGSEPYIFISYAHKDRDVITPILQRLTADGCRIWYDEGIDPGTEWPESIARHLESSSVCLSFISPYSAASKNCRREINFALSRNIPLLTIFLEDTKISPGLEMQISTYQSIMGYRYPDLASLMERVESVDVTEPCRGPAGTAASSGKISAQWAPAAPKKRRTVPLIAAAVLVLAAAAAVFLLRSGRKPEEIIGSAAEPAESAGPAAETAASSASAPESGPGQVPEGFSAMILGKWDDGSVLLCGDGDKTVYIELTDDRIPYAYSFSEQPGNDNAEWHVVITFGEGYSLSFDISPIPSNPSFSGLHTEKSQTMRQERKNLGSFRYTLMGNTFCFKSLLPADFMTEDIDSINVFIGSYTDGYYFFLKE
jgi:hypothetical protein